MRFETRQALENDRAPVSPAPPAKTPDAAKSEATAIAIAIPALFIAGLAYFSFKPHETVQTTGAVDACRSELTRITGPSGPLKLSYEPTGSDGTAYSVLITVDGGNAGRGTIDCTARLSSDGSWKASLGPLTY